MTQTLIWTEKKKKIKQSNILRWNKFVLINIFKKIAHLNISFNDVNLTKSVFETSNIFPTIENNPKSRVTKSDDGISHKTYLSEVSSVKKN